MAGKHLVLRLAELTYEAGRTNGLKATARDPSLSPFPQLP